MKTVGVSWKRPERGSVVKTSTFPCLIEVRMVAKFADKASATQPEGGVSEWLRQAYINNKKYKYINK